MTNNLKFFVIFFLVLFINGCSNSDSPEVIPDEPNQVPIANAGPNKNVEVGAVVRLDGSKSYDRDKNTIEYEWVFQSKPDGSSAKLSKNNTSHPKFTPDLVGAYVIQLVVSDDESSSEPSTVTINSAKGNVAPNANAGENLSVIVNSEVILDGSKSSDANDDALVFNWSVTSQPSGSNISLSDQNTSHPKFTPTFGGDYVFSLTVSDGNLTSEPATVTVLAIEETSNAKPIANAGIDVDVHTGDMVELYGGQSFDADGDNISYTWHFVNLPAGSTVSLSDENIPNPQFTPDLDGVYVIALIVNDGQEDSEPDMVTVTATTFSFKEQLLNYGIEPKDADYLLDKHFDDVVSFLNDDNKIFKNLPSLNSMFALPTDPDAGVFQDTQMTFWSQQTKRQFIKMFGRFVFVVNSERFKQAFNDNIGLLDRAFQGNSPSIPYPNNYEELRRDANKAMEDGHYQFKFFISDRQSYIAWGVQGLKLKVENVMFGPGTPGAVHNTEALILHELTHSWGYAHAGLGIPSGTPPVNNIPYYVQGLVGGSYKDPGAPLVYDTPDALLTIYFGNDNQ